MSLINEVLRDLETRRGGALEAGEAVIAGLRPSETAPAGGRAFRWPVPLLLLAVAMLLLGLQWIHRGGPWAGAPVGTEAATGATLPEEKIPDTAAMSPEQRRDPALAGGGQAGGDDAAMLLPGRVLEETTTGLVEALAAGLREERPILEDPARLAALGPGAVAIDPGTGAVATVLRLDSALPWSQLLPPRETAARPAVPAPARARETSGPDAHGSPAMERPQAGADGRTGRRPAGVATEGKTPGAVLRRPVASSPAEVLRRADSAWRQGHADEAQRLLSALLREHPGQGGARLLLSRILQQAGRGEEAGRVLEEGLELDPADPLLAMARAETLARRGASRQALEVLQRARDRGGADPRFLAFIASLSQRVGEHSRAVEAYRRALAARPDEAVWWLGLGISLQALGDEAGALRAYRRALAGGDLKDTLRDFARGRLARLERRVSG